VVLGGSDAHQEPSTGVDLTRTGVPGRDEPVGIHDQMRDCHHVDQQSGVRSGSGNDAERLADALTERQQLGHHSGADGTARVVTETATTDRENITSVVVE
jgi:hypothetical protein